MPAHPGWGRTRRTPQARRGPREDAPLESLMVRESMPATWPSPDPLFEERQASAETVSFEERLQWAAKHVLPRSNDDIPILVGSGGRRATSEELLEFVAHEQERIARGG